jgi:hypothetical protein
MSKDIVSLIKKSGGKKFFELKLSEKDSDLKEVQERYCYLFRLKA